eukprot:4134609-Amphidinium_carterae.1
MKAAQRESQSTMAAFVPFQSDQEGLADQRKSVQDLVTIKRKLVVLMFEFFTKSRVANVAIDNSIIVFPSNSMVIVRAHTHTHSRNEPLRAEVRNNIVSRVIPNV